jgi:pilus assembly protein TadC
VNERRLAALLASLLLLALPVAEFLRNGQASNTAVGALLILAFGGGGYAADRAIKARVRRWINDDEDDEDA